MKLLLDQNLSFKLCDRLADLFPGTSHVRLIGMETASDREIWEYAKNNDFALVTQDSDFAELSLHYGAPPHVVWLRCGNQPTGVIESLIRNYVRDIMTLESDLTVSCLEIYQGHA